MANYVSSALLAFQSKINKKFNANELREQQNPIIRQAMAYAPLIVANVDAIKESDKRAVKSYFLKKSTATNGTARSYNHTGSQADSVEITHTWVTFSETLKIQLQVGADNIFDTWTMLDHQIAEKQRILRERIGTYVVTQLHAARTQVANATIKNGAWNVTNFAFENAANQSDKVFQNMASIMRQHKYYGKLDVIADAVIYKQADYLSNQGGSNSSNLSFQFKDFNPNGIMEHTILGTTVATSYANGTAIVLPEASMSLIPWIPGVNRQGRGDYESYNGGWGTVPDSTGLPFEFAVHGYAQRADGSTLGSVVQDLAIELELSVDISFNTAPFSTAGETAVYEFGQL